MPAERYDAEEDLASRYPEWTVLWRRIRCPELIYPDARLIVLDDVEDPDPNSALAHAIVHLDLHDCWGDTDFTDSEEAHATFLAEIRLGRHYQWAS